MIHRSASVHAKAGQLGGARQESRPISDNEVALALSSCKVRMCMCESVLFVSVCKTGTLCMYTNFELSVRVIHQKPIVRQGIGADSKSQGNGFGRANGNGIVNQKSKYTAQPRAGAGVFTRAL